MQTIDLRKELLNTPLLLSENEAKAFRAFAPESFQIDVERQSASAAGQAMFGFGMSDDTPRKPYRMAGGAAIIPITGVLIHRMNWGFSGATGYDYVRNMFDAALADPDVKGIVFDVNSPGGMVDGAFDLADHIYANRSVKPSMSIVDAHAYSAGYLLASAAGQMSIPKTGGAGSIGVVVMHSDVSKMLDDFGVKITFIHAGARKVEGNPYEALSDEAKARIQTSVDQSYDMFVSSVVKHRGMSDEAVRGTEAGVFSAQEALSLNLVDAIESPQAALSAFVAELSGVMREEKPMATKNADQSATNENTITQADLDAATKAGAKAERERSAAVMNHESYKGREALANHLMDTTDMTAEAISSTIAMQPVAAVAPAPVATAGAGNDHGFARAMESTGNPEAGADNSNQVPEEEDVAARAARNYQAQTGAKLIGLK